MKTFAICVGLYVFVAVPFGIWLNKRFWTKRKLLETYAQRDMEEAFQQWDFRIMERESKWRVR